MTGNFLDFSLWTGDEVFWNLMNVKSETYYWEKSDVFCT